MWSTFYEILKNIDNFVWSGLLIGLILITGIFLSIRLKVLQIIKLPLALKFMVMNEDNGKGEITSFAALGTVHKLFLKSCCITRYATIVLR